MYKEKELMPPLNINQQKIVNQLNNKNSILIDLINMCEWPFVVLNVPIEKTTKRYVNIIHSLLNINYW